MEKLKKVEAFARAKAAFGPCRTWSRAHYIAYGLIRGVPYPVMERCSNDIPPTYWVALALACLGAWPPVRASVSKDAVRRQTALDHCPEVNSLVVWVRKTPRGPRIRPSTGAAPVAATG
jgi:hypothetical protein